MLAASSCYSRDLWLFAIRRRGLARLPRERDASAAAPRCQHERGRGSGNRRRRFQRRVDSSGVELRGNIEVVGVLASVVAIVAMKFFGVPAAAPPGTFRDMLAANRVRAAATVRQQAASRVKNGLVGIALSGGGIRSATTNLGILQRSPD